MDTTDNIFLILREDVSSCLQQLNKHDTQFWRRNYVRAVFAFFEGSVFVMKRMTLDEINENALELPAATEALLMDESYELSEDAEPVSRRLHLPLARNVKFAFESFARALGASLQIDPKDLYDFKQAVKVRNRITHPKTNEDVVISDADLTVVKKAEQWFEHLLATDTPKRLPSDS